MWSRTASLLVACAVVVGCSEDAPVAGLDGTGGGAGGNGGTASTTTTGGAGGDGGMGGAGDSGGAGGSGGGPVLNVLFVGNSYTYVNDLPGLVRGLSDAGPSFTTDTVTAGGATLQDHVDTSGAVGVIQQGGWDMVVLQGQSVEPLAAPASFHSGALALDAEIDDVAADTVMFETWARAAGDSIYQQPWSGGDPIAMQAGLSAAYQAAATATGGATATVGEAWESVLANYPAIVLHSGDGSHPTLAGSYLAACVFFLTLSGADAIDAPQPAPAGLSEEDAANLRAVAEAIVQ